MEIIETTAKEFKGVFDNPYHVFASIQFTELNKEKYDQVIYLFFKGTKIRLGLTLARRKNEIYSPVSAPFGGFVVNKSDISINAIDQAVDALVKWVQQKGFTLEIMLPPLIYASDFLSKCVSAFSRSQAKVEQIDLNYQIEINPKVDYIDRLNYTGKKNLTTALKYQAELNFQKVLSIQDIERAYGIIAQNRQAKGYPLRMTFEQIIETTKIIKADFFILSHKGIGIAAAQVFHVSPGIVQVIYWGDIPDHSEIRPMNYLAAKMVEYYTEQKIKVIDIGPSTENGVPNYGLCDYKESIGCSISLKYKFKI